MPNFISVTASIAELDQGKKSHTQSLTHPAYLMSRELKLVLQNLLDAVITPVGKVQIHSSQCPSDHFITICQVNCMISIIKAYIKHTTAVKSTDSEEDRRAYSTACYQANNLINASHNQQCNQCISEPGSDSRRICSAVKDSLLSETTTDVGKCKQNAVFCSTLVAFCLLQPRKACVG